MCACVLSPTLTGGQLCFGDQQSALGAADARGEQGVVSQAAISHRSSITFGNSLEERALMRTGRLTLPASQIP